MKLVIASKKKANVFTAIFQNLNKFTVDININFKEEEMYIQGMDSSHCSMFEINLKKEWFEDYQCDQTTTIGINSLILYKIFTTRQDNQIIVMEYVDNNDKMDICFKNLEKAENEFQKEFSIPLMDIETDVLAVPEVDFDIYININTKSFTTMVSQLEIFGDVVTLDYSDEKLFLKADGDNGKIGIVLKDEKTNNLNMCDINIDDSLNLSYSVKYISYFCSFSKINSNVNILFKESMPMLVHYELENSKDSYIKFYLAPKIDD